MKITVTITEHDSKWGDMTEKKEFESLQAAEQFTRDFNEFSAPQATESWHIRASIDYKY